VKGSQMIEKFRVKTADLTRQCTDDPFDFSTTDDLDPLDSVIGQRRAVEAIGFGLEMTGPGYNIFVTGYEGTGKSTITREILTVFAKKQDTPDDLCLVNNFDDPSANVNNLMVKKAVRDAVEQGLFHIYQVSTIEQGIAVLTGVHAGRADENFVFPGGTVFGAVKAKLKWFHEQSVRCSG